MLKLTKPLRKKNTMPNRLLKEGIVDSDRINSLSAQAEVFFYRLLVVSDDFGCMDARTSILRARCFPLRDNVSSDHINKWILELLEQKLLISYTCECQPYVQILKWEQRVRSKGKYPQPTDEQMTDSCQTDDSNVQTYDGLGKGKGRGKGASTNIRFDANNGSFDGIEESQMEIWKKAFPAVNLQLEIAKAGAWIVANPKQTKSNYNRFLTSWFTRCQDSGGTRVKEQSTSGSNLMKGVTYARS